MLWLLTLRLCIAAIVRGGERRPIRLYRVAVRLSSFNPPGLPLSHLIFCFSHPSFRAGRIDLVANHYIRHG